MNELIHIAWERMKIIASIVGDAQARVIATLFYFTILVPFGLIARQSNDVLRLRDTSRWLERAPIPNDMENAKRQG